MNEIEKRARELLVEKLQISGYHQTAGALERGLAGYIRTEDAEAAIITALATRQPQGVPVEAMYDCAHSASDGIRVVRYQRQGSEVRVLDVTDHNGKTIGEVVADAQLHLLGHGFWLDAKAVLHALAAAVAPADARFAGTLWRELVLAAATSSDPQP